MSVENLEDLKKIEHDIKILKSDIESHNRSLYFLGNVRRNNTIPNFISIEANMKYRYEVNDEAKRLLNKQLAAYQPDFIRTVEMRLESQIRGFKNQLKMKQQQLDNFFQND